jgi:hypothetical protein
MKLAGTVYDSTGTKPVLNAVAMAVRVKDSLLLGFARTDYQGKFQLNGFEVDTFSLIISHPNYDDKTYYIFGHADNFDITIPSIVMPSKAQEIEEVIIYAYKDPIYYKGDTLVYVADSFATHEGAVVEDLLKKLPGIKVDKDGKITSQGQEIGKVLVDGDEFFGSDPTIATKNLGADGIAEVQVYEKENEDGIGGDDEKIQVLDLRLKEDAKKGYFGRISGASDFALTPIGDKNEIGTNPFYEGELLLNKFKGAQKISVFALGSNTPRSSFGWGDMNKFGLENESGGGNRWNPGASTNTSGIPQTLKAGVYYSDKFGKKKQNKIGFNYSYYNDRLDAVSESESQYFLTDSTYFTDDYTRDYTANESHRINVNFESQLDSLTSIQIKPSFTIDKGITENEDVSTFFNDIRDTTIATSVSNNNDSKGYTAGGYARLNRKFMKKRRELEVRYDLSLNNNQTDGLLDSRTTYYSLALANDSTLQKKNNDNSTMNHYGTITYVEPLAKKLKLEFEYLYQYGFSAQDKRTRDFDGTDYTIENSIFTNLFNTTRQQHRLGTQLIYETSKHTISGGLRVRNINIDNLNKVTDSLINQNISNVLPRFRYMYKPSMSKRFNVDYETTSSQPSISDLQPIPDNSNPNRLKVGNPDLLPNYQHAISLGFNTWNALSGRYIYAGGRFSLTQNAFATETNYDDFGRTISKTVNVNGNAMAFIYSGAGLPFFGRKFEINPALNASYFRTVSIISGSENITDNYAVTPELNFEFNLLGDSLEIDFENSFSFNNAVSSLNNTSNPYSIGRYAVGFKWTLPRGFTISSLGTFTKNNQPGDGFYDTQYFVLNAELSKKFLKTQNLQVALVGNDILNQNINARREINGNIVTDYRTTIISRYFLMKVTLRFNNRKAKEDDFNGMH